MTTQPQRDAERQQALLALEPFTGRLLRQHIRRHRRCRGASSARRSQIFTDLQQELRADCIEHAKEVLLLPARERHTRWFRIAERWIYRETRDAFPWQDDWAEPLSAGDDGILAVRDSEAQRGLGFAARHGWRTTDQDGVTITAFAERTGLGRRAARRVWSRAVARIGYGREYTGFWRRRLAEAAAGMAADLLRDAGLVALLPRPRSRPDPEGRRRRIRRILRMLAVAPLSAEVIGAIAEGRLRHSVREMRPLSLLRAAERLDPSRADLLLWRFEAAFAIGALDEARDALRTALVRGVDRAAVRLARARLAAHRFGVAAGSLALRRAQRLHPADARIERALRCAEGRDAGIGPGAALAARESASPRG